MSYEQTASRQIGSPIPVTPQALSEVDRETSDLRKQINTIGDVVQELRKRLGPVLSDSEEGREGGGASTPEPNCQSPHGRDLQAIKFQTRDLTDMVRGILIALKV